jgi:hypothetical protein
MNKKAYEEIENFVYRTLMDDGENDVKIVRIEITSDTGNKEIFEYQWNNKENLK